MGKLTYTDSETENTSSSIETVKKSQKPSILKPYHTGPLRKKKCKIHDKVETSDIEYREYSKSASHTSCPKKIRGILKNSNGYQSEREQQRSWEFDARNATFISSEDEDDAPEKKARCLVGRVPRSAGAKPGRGGGVALVIRKAVKEPAKVHVKTSTLNSACKKNKKKIGQY